MTDGPILHELINRRFGRLRTIESREKALLESKGLSDEVIERLLHQWLEREGSEGPCDIMSLSGLVHFDWQENLVRHGLLSIGSCSNGDFIAVEIGKIGEWPVHYVSHEHEEVYKGLAPRTVRVSTSLMRFLEEMATDADYPWDYFEALRRL